MKPFLFFLMAGGAMVVGTNLAWAGNIPVFGKTCVGKSGWNTDVCVSSNGKTLLSSYKWKGTVATKGTHTGCSVSGNVISCSAGTYATASGSGTMDSVRVTLANGKPVSLTWN